MDVTKASDILVTLSPGLLALVVSRFFAASQRAWDGVPTAVYGLALTVLARLIWDQLANLMTWISCNPVIDDQFGPQFCGILLGLVLAQGYRRNWRGKLLQKLGLPDSESVWLGAFSRHANKYVVITLTNEERVYGFARAVSKDAKDGHILLEQASFQSPLGTLTTSSPENFDRALMFRIADITAVEFYGRIEVP